MRFALQGRQLVSHPPSAGQLAASAVGGRRLRSLRSHRRAAEKDLDWEPDLQRKGPLFAPRGPSGLPPPPPPPPPRRNPNIFEMPLASRRNISLSLLGGGALVWLFRTKFSPIQFADKPDIPFELGYTNLTKDLFVYFKTPGGNWVAAANDDEGRLYLIDQAGDLYYDTGDPEIGLYIMDREGNLYNSFMDGDGERKIVPVGNVSDLRGFKVSEIAGVKLDREVNVVAFKDGSRVSLPVGSGYLDRNGKFKPPQELMEGFVDTGDDVGPNGLFGGLLGGSFAVPDRVELDINDPTPFDRQIFDQTLLADPDMDGFRPALPEDFDLEELAREVEEEERAAGR